MPCSGDWETESKIQISYANRANRNLKDRLVLQDGQKDRQAQYLYVSARCLRSLMKLPSRRAAAVSTVDLFLNVLSDPALSRAGEVSEIEMLACLATLGDP